MKHEDTLIYQEYPLNVPSPPEYYLLDFKRSSIFNIKKKLTLHHRSLGKKSLTISCSEGVFLSIFGDNIQRYSPARRFHLCSFVGEEGNVRDLHGNKTNKFMLIRNIHKSIV